MAEENQRQVPDIVLGVELGDDMKKLLAEGKETGLIEGFISERTGKPFSAYLRLDAANRIRYRFPKKGGQKSFKKSNKVPTKVGGVELDPEDIEDLKEGRETKLIVGIESKKKGRYYDAYLRWNEEKGIIFRFPGMD